MFYAAVALRETGSIATARALVQRARPFLVAEPLRGLVHEGDPRELTRGKAGRRARRLNEWRRRSQKNAFVFRLVLRPGIAAK